MMKNFETRREFEEHFYASWSGWLEKATYDDKLKEVKAAYPETLLWLKTMVMQYMSGMETA